MQAARRKFVSYCAGLVKTDFRTYKSSPLSTFPLILRNKANVQQVSGCGLPDQEQNVHLLLCFSV